MPTPETLLLAALITTATYSIFGLTGFGSTVLALPLLAYFLPLKFAVPLLLLLDLSAALALSAGAKRGVRVDELGRILPFLLAGIALGLTLLIKLPEGPLLAGLGVFLLVYAGLWPGATGGRDEALACLGGTDRLGGRSSFRALRHGGRADRALYRRAPREQE